MDGWVVGLVLAAAFMHATWNAIVKSGGDRLVSIAVTMTVAAALSSPLILAGDPPRPESWPFIALSVALHTAYFLMLARTYRLGDLSHAYPLARGVAPPLVALGAALAAGEWLSLPETIAIAVISLGILSLALGSRFRLGADARATFHALATGALIAIYTVVDGLGVRAAGTPMGYIGWLIALSPLPLLVIVAKRRGRAVGASLVRHAGPAMVGGVLSFAGYGIAIWALSLGPMAHVSALRETSVLIAAVIGSRVLGEPFGVRRVLAAATVALGVIALETA